MSKRSARNTLQERNENAPEQTNKPQRKRKGECNRRIPSAAKKQHYEIQNRCIEGDISPSVLIETPQKDLLETSNRPGFKRFRFKNLFVKPSPLPCLSWASSDDVWIKMLNKELKYVHDKGFIQQHPAMQPKMRSILLDWLMEVSEVYTLHRETFYLAQDIFDRFMLTQKDIGKDQLQLIGVTSLFIASKIEEIYPPKLQEFAYVTDGACSEEEILAEELVMLKALKWDLCPETVISWLKLYSQVDSLQDGTNFLIPQFSQETYIQITQLLDLCILDVNSLDYQYGVLAAAAFCHFTSFETVHKVSGLTWDSISSCVRWMNPFVRTVSEWPRPQLKDFKKVTAENYHNIQTHVDYLVMLGEAHDRQQDSLDRMSPLAVGGLLTPPKSTEKPVNV
ncbi:G1/S-specific cyclin-E2-like isoform X2 [Myxocyprinus asiaticus]|uniref:G1/S-specific cyclin-E2-like isoform X2 n=1 Tax=Myxocyprinus asiaticus TaxID=70543 RepID=UPI00222314FC|nr:G1/S-specific cyclin-E2-like isoform X2 [Myxocyprinus asiaticus]